MSYWIVDGQKLTNEQYEESERQKELDEQKIQEETERLSRQLSQAYGALKEHLERNPEVSQEITDEEELDQQIYYNLRQNLHQADAAPRCVWIREDGTVCKSPRMKNDIHCYAHYQMRHARAENLWLPALTDANAIQLAVMLVQRALIDDEITEKKAGLLLYSIQIAAANADKTTFGESDEEMVTEIELEDDVMEAHNRQMEKLKRIKKAKNLPLINTDKTGEKISPRINTDETDLKTGEQNLPLMNTEYADLKREQGLPRMDADGRGSEPGGLPLIHTKDAEQAGTTTEGGCATQASLAPEVYANRSQNPEVRANLG
ncbi:MAG: hypothetical protein WA672_02715 [Candidatus Angelobacter sp.]